MEYKDYYAVLGVSREASAEELKRAYRKLARRYHPDVSKEANAEQHFKEVQEAYEVLKDPEKRQAYDQLGSQWQQGQDFRPPPGWETASTSSRAGFSESDFSDFFESLFGGGSPFSDVSGRGHQRGFRSRGSDASATIGVTLEEAYQGATKTIALETGTSAGQQTRNLRVRIPAGVTDGRRIRLAGQASPGVGGAPAGDVYLEVQMQPHGRYALRGKDIYLDLPVAPWEAALGATLKIPTLGGEVTLKIPAASQSGKRMRLRGRGLPGEPAGDQYVTLRIVNPPAQQQAMRELFERMRDTSEFDPRAAQ